MSNQNEMSVQYGFNAPAKQTTDMVEIEQARAMYEVQASIAIAKKFPRDPNQAFANIMTACKRPNLAEQAKYAYPRGGKVVTGPSIRLAEVVVQNWGNVNYGIKELSNANGVSVMQAFAWDLETNTKQEKTFQVPHKRYTKNGSYPLTDPRDIYELVANYGARRLRACIIGIIPPDIIEAAEEQCEKTLKEGKEPLGDRVKKLVVAFSEFGINVSQVEKRLGHKLDAVIEQEIIILRAIYKSIKDGMAKREEFFDFGVIDDEVKEESASKSESMANKLKTKKSAPTEPVPSYSEEETKKVADDFFGEE